MFSWAEPTTTNVSPRGTSPQSTHAPSAIVLTAGTSLTFIDRDNGRTSSTFLNDDMGFPWPTRGSEVNSNGIHTTQLTYFNPVEKLDHTTVMYEPD